MHLQATIGKLYSVRIVVKRAHQLPTDGRPHSSWKYTNDIQLSSFSEVVHRPHMCSKVEIPRNGVEVG